ncbi:acyl-ACP--UDP-N-acetylglucosamine O-acyltransferase [Taylorella equigenitalis]|uniref:acyl-ACP--UDP-N-acetylglucosamine O-acyltransferase n=1 Tax=Taylorella equigenitalis TaxID=29575 RepID=UPI0023B02719|nr:acyl-ACP--UDP-N-acetylglucosamine O-acyltransferase [Taylorella equigenitalis]WED99720.1 acyl-ACP--UDP-N-acetylglucosamine O-acyltransferase [Taylorella equigenitalis]WEE01198.1 acyl-ACP--UDP-N-acetylglucosamine O-acyltransferase [Taylorella equigenitalis]WFD77735.1 acyl-ACP--UDP-N-acetylglucosamine O-acyltransferase [Taylorella equigenitalis]WFD79213.1 acyl-ACP--UDP-N-acetylglucosamine O-acyltransferase [Taylorella equigenitalis]WFD80689.1 acyl-ACP--UDP-N-acetylglucosamine O-acyltransferas
MSNSTLDSSNRDVTSIVYEGAELHPSVKVGAYSIIYPNVKIGAGTVIGDHCVIDGHTTIGENNRFYRFCSIGGMPQDKKYNAEDTKLEIGDGNTFREFVTINTGTVQDVGVTRIGDNNWIMAYVHIAHDCQIGSNTILANSVQLGGHVHINDWAIIGGMSAVHQFIHIGAHSMTGGMSAIRQDIPPFVLGAGQPYKSVGVNSLGLRRRDFTNDQIQDIKEAYKIIYSKDLVADDVAKELIALKESSPSSKKYIQMFIDFLESSARGISKES